MVCLWFCMKILFLEILVCVVNVRRYRGMRRAPSSWSIVGSTFFFAFFTNYLILKKKASRMTERQDTTWIVTVLVPFMGHNASQRRHSLGPNRSLAAMPTICLPPQQGGTRTDSSVHLWLTNIKADSLRRETRRTYRSALFRVMDFKAIPKSASRAAIKER